MIKVADFVIDYFNKKEIDTAFTISGGGCIHLIEALRKSKMDIICPHHEQSALMASEGYFRMKNKIALNVVTTGPGGTNTLTGLLGLWLDSIPSIIISGQVPSSQLSEGTGCRQIGDQEFNIVEVVKPMTKYAAMVKDSSEILRILDQAYFEATTGRPGPVWIDIPLDIQGAFIEENTLRGFTDKENILPPSEKDIETFKQLLHQSKKPLVVVGNGIRLSNTYDKVNKFLTKTGIPVVTGPHSGVDAVDNTLPNYCGRIGILGQLTSNTIVQEADLIIGLGTRLPVKMTGYNIAEFSPKSKKVFVDIDKVICIEGDGSIMMNLQELETVVGNKLPIKIIIINNDGYLSIKLSQEAFFKGEEFASSPATGVTIPNFEKIANAFGIRYSSIKHNSEIESVLNNMMDIEGACIVEVFIHPKERHEPKVTHKGVGPDGKIIPGTLTDMFISDTF
jgi:thiamine pyrophosphate-dependent acetolactate synthase large subunit-like protein